ncbi:MAG: thiopurine S-methyltransferase [Alphaproteobacteria bacterium]|nr:thiopurine S-methyltransferase [Alphaproteobacteria bacterium]
MDADFWHERWKANQINFHEGKANALLVAHFDALALSRGARVFVPLCGKTRDIAWLLAKGHRVAGAELSQTAIDQLFTELDVEPTLTNEGKMIRYSAPDLDIHVGDIFDLTVDLLGPVDAIVDRAALVALPDEMRKNYARHLIEIAAHAKQLVITFEYDQSQMAGPPFCVTDDEIRRLYAAAYELTHLTRVEVPGGLKGKVSATESAWFLDAPR